VIPTTQQRILATRSISEQDAADQRFQRERLPEVCTGMNRRQFTFRGLLTLAVAGLTGSAFKCSSEKVTIYVQTITSFLREVGSLIPAQAAFINKIIGIAGNLDSAYRRGDFDSTTTFLESLSGNINVLITNLGVDLSAQVKVALAIVNSTVRLIAVLLVQQASDPTVTAAVKSRTSAEDMRKRNLIESLANEQDIDAIFKASRN